MIKFNKIHYSGKEIEYINEAISLGKISGNGYFTNKCQTYFEHSYGFKKVLLTPSCTNALELACLLLEIKEGDEIIAPSYTFVSSVNPFVLRGAKIIFADSGELNPNIDADKLEALITPNTKAIVPVHYAGVSCDMDKIMALAKKYNLFVVEDAAHSIDSFYKNRPLGSIGHLAAFSFHDTKNIISGEGGMLVINDERFLNKVEIIREMGTNKASFLRGETPNYEWVDVGSSFLPSEITAAFLYAQIECLKDIQQVRKDIWNKYYNGLRELQEAGKIKLPQVPDYGYNNAHLFYFLCSNLDERNALISYLKQCQITTAFHYLSLHRSAYYSKKHDGRTLNNADMYTNTLIRLPLYYDLTEENIQYIISSIYSFYTKEN